MLRNTAYRNFLCMRMWVVCNWLLCLWKKWQLRDAWSHKSLSPLFSSIEMACTEYSTVPETPEAQRTTKESYFKRRRGVQFFDVSDSEDEEPRNAGAAQESRAPRGETAVMYALSSEPASVLSLHPGGCSNLKPWMKITAYSFGVQLLLTKLDWLFRGEVAS